jgi:hypothetical protein
MGRLFRQVVGVCGFCVYTFLSPLPRGTPRCLRQGVRFTVDEKQRRSLLLAVCGFTSRDPELPRSRQKAASPRYTCCR